MAPSISTLPPTLARTKLTPLQARVSQEQVGSDLQRGRDKVVLETGAVHVDLSVELRIGQDDVFLEFAPRK